MLRLGYGMLKNGKMTYWLMIIVSIVVRLCQWRHPLLSIPWSHLLLWGWWREKWESSRNRASEGAVGVDVCENGTLSSFCVKMHDHLQEYTRTSGRHLSSVEWYDVFACVCVCVCVWEREREREREGMPAVVLSDDVCVSSVLWLVLWCGGARLTSSVPLTVTHTHTHTHTRTHTQTNTNTNSNTHTHTHTHTHKQTLPPPHHIHTHLTHHKLIHKITKNNIPYTAHQAKWRHIITIDQPQH